MACPVLAENNSGGERINWTGKRLLSQSRLKWTKVFLIGCDIISKHNLKISDNHIFKRRPVYNLRNNRPKTHTPRTIWTAKKQAAVEFAECFPDSIRSLWKTQTSQNWNLLWSCCSFEEAFVMKHLPAPGKTTKKIKYFHQHPSYCFLLPKAASSSLDYSTHGSHRNRP